MTCDAGEDKHMDLTVLQKPIDKKYGSRRFFLSASAYMPYVGAVSQQ